MRPAALVLLAPLAFTAARSEPPAQGEKPPEGEAPAEEGATVEGQPPSGDEVPADEDAPEEDEPFELPPDPVARELFRANCASCHGETGGGDGWAELDRRARSFRDGGFSFGNTPEAIFRTVSVGIPGTPMPSFGTSLSEEERRRLADFVIALGPPREEVDPSETVLVVRDRPLAVRGLLPPIEERAATQPRGLLLGTVDGLTFEYRADDVRLLGVLQGDFVERTDWRGRGGSALQPLGRVVYLAEGEHAPWTFSDGAAVEELRAELRATSTAGGAPSVEYDVVDGDEVLYEVRETVHSAATAFGSGYRVHYDVVQRRRRGGTIACVPLPAPAELLGETREAGRHHVYAFRREDGLVEQRALISHGWDPVESPATGAPPPAEHAFDWIVLVGPEWSPEHLDALTEVSW